MAEFGAHLTGSVGETPSIFEVLATDGLTKGLKLAFKHFISVLAQNNPSRYELLHKLDEEFYALIDFIVQYYHLKKYNASFSENFYGLRRTLRPRDKIGQLDLTNSQFVRSLCLLVGLPYLLSILLKTFTKLREQSESDRPDQRLKVQKLLLLLYPYVNLTANSITAIYQILYAVGKISTHSPMLHLANCELRTLTSSDMVEEEDCTAPSMNPFSLLHRASYNSVKIISKSMSVGAFFLQFVEWWYGQEGTHRTIGSRPIPDPPRNRSECRPGICPICHQKVKNETVLLTSGYVFCYRCIHQSLTHKQQCPMTKYPAHHSQLVKLYPPDD